MARLQGIQIGTGLLLLALLARFMLWDIIATAIDKTASARRMVLPPPRPHFNFSSDLHLVQQRQASIQLVVIIRVHSGYYRQLIAMLAALDVVSGQTRLKVSALVLPLDFKSAQNLRPLVQKHQSIDTLVEFIDLPEQVYIKFDTELSVLCSGKHLSTLQRRHKPILANRVCEINSPLHYALVDLALAAVVKTQSNVHAYLLVTNADNLYSTNFFTPLSSILNDSSSLPPDLVYSDWINKGEVFVDASPGRHALDLGGYLFRVGFLQSHSQLSFLNSLPDNPSARDYHDADGHFVNAVMKAGARPLKTKGYFYFHE